MIGGGGMERKCRMEEGGEGEGGEEECTAGMNTAHMHLS